MKKIKTGIVAIFIVAFIATIALFLNVYRENITYKNYLSDILSNRVSPLISNISNIERTLAEVIENETINKSQASSLQGNFNSIKSQNQNIIDLGIRLNKIPTNKIEKVIATNAKISDYFKKINDVLETDEVDLITPAQLEGFKEFQGLASLYKKIAKSNVLGVTETGVSGEFWNRYFVDGVDKEYWVNLIIGIEDVTPEFTDFTLLQ